MTLNLAQITETDWTPADHVERHAVSTYDHEFYNQHGDSSRWSQLEWDAYHRLIANALGRFRAEVSAL